MTRSMTGFARQEASYSWGQLSWEIRSVNHRYLEPHFRLPEGLRAIESELRQRLRKGLNRGKIEMALALQLDATQNAFDINQDVLSNLSQAMTKIASSVPQLTAATPIDVLNWPGILASAALDNDALQEAALELFDQALKQLVAHREREGEALKQIIQERLDAIGKEVVKVGERIPQIRQHQKEKLVERITAVTEVDPERLEQELVLFAQKMDVDEELDRLVTHVTEIEKTLKQKGPIGRRLDFLMQELNREANTLSSKSVAADTTQSAVELKTLIEQMRGQIQNIE